MLLQNSLHLMFNFVGIMFSISQAHATSCQVYPSEYAYHADSVTRSESTSANCRRYPSDHTDGIFVGNYIHCDGTQGKLTDSDLGRDQYSSSDYYVWNAGSDRKLLFTFPTAVSLTTITLHYYSDSHRGLPSLRFYNVPDDFNVWDAPTTGHPRVEVNSVLPGGEQAGHRNIRINVTFNTMKVLMYKFSSSFMFAVSEAKFFKCNHLDKVTTISLATSTMAEIFTSSVTNDSTMVKNFASTNSFAKSTSTTPSFKIDAVTRMSTAQSNLIIGIGVSIATLLILSITLIITVVALTWIYKKRSVKQVYTDSTYSTISRGTGQQIQPQSIEYNSAQLYDQIHLSPSTGQTEFIPKPQSENINKPPYNSHPGTENHVTLSAESKTNPPQAIYAAVDKSKKKQMKRENTNHTAAEKKDPPVSRYTQKVSSISADKGAHAGGKDDPMNSSQKSLDDMYASDHKDQEKVNCEQESNLPHTVKELYTAIKKKSKGTVPVKEPVSHMAEDLYTAVMKKPKLKESSIDGEAAPPLPPHTVEELYTAVQKKPRGSAVEDEEEAPPIHPYTAEDTFF